DEAYALADAVKERLQRELLYPLKIVIGGTPTFHLYAHHQEVELSPGTFVFWDEGYQSTLPDLPFTIAAVVMTRVISKIDDHTVCVDLGHKSIASENPFPRIRFLGIEAEEVSHSEEHLVVSVPDAGKHFIGEAWYGIPYHICPTIALYDSVYVVENQRVENTWKVVARDRAITV
ncbi:MAG: D-TA family PLP-dependent enzyme, partial [Segetibacter sp.]